MSSAEKELIRWMGKAITQRNMIEDGDRLLVGVSGGLDSLSLLYLLKKRLRWIPIEYELYAIHIDLGFGGNTQDKLKEFFESISVKYRIVPTDIGIRAHSEENRENPCFLCSWHRKRLLFEIADELKCNKIALAHHKDDVIETFLINLLYSGSISTIKPVQDFFNGRFHIIRPFYLTEKSLIIRFSKKMQFPAIEQLCPSSKGSKREKIRGLLRSLYREDPKIKGNIFHAIHNVRREYLP